ncbi:MAG: hypothetical protein WBA05_10690 [Gordonia sp. (in: high G+C Gram-positive bacteria)]|uniref:hypothetical protein n=1 Tax=Gordonia TaxID=2053 RepID=UPI003267FBAD
MRSVASGLFTVIAMVAMVIAVPSAWLSQRVVSTDGFVASASEAAKTTEVQDYFAQKVADSVAQATGSQIASSLVLPAARNYSRSEGFVEDFSQVARQQHDWLFNPPAPGVDLHLMELDITPMINRVIASAPIPVPVRIQQPVVITIDQGQITAGSMEDTGTLVSVAVWVSLVTAAVGSILALLLARRRGTVLAWLGVGAVLAGVVGAILAAFTKTIISDRLANTDAAARDTIEVVVRGVADNLTTVSTIVGAVGAVVVVAGIIARTVGGRRVA